MLQVTGRATQELRNLLEENEIEPGAALRLNKNSSGSLEFAVALTQEGDQVVLHEDRKVLLVDKELSAALTGVQMDVEETEKGSQFVLASLSPPDGRNNGA